jgi:hypothetical protein
VLNFSIWLWRRGELNEAEMREQIRQWAGREPFERYRNAQGHPLWEEYAPVGQAWHDSEGFRQVDSSRTEKPRDRRAHYRAMAAIGVRLQVQWVMAPFGQRWLLPPDLAVLGAECASAEDRRAAVLDAARALRQEE